MAENSEKSAKVRGTPFPKGETGNPNGRPKGQRNFATIYREALIKLADMNDVSPEDMEVQIAMKGLGSARKGDYRFWKDIHDRIHGTATQKHDHTTKGDKITFTDEQLANIFKRRGASSDTSS